MKWNRDVGQLPNDEYWIGLKPSNGKWRWDDSISGSPNYLNTNDVLENDVRHRTRKSRKEVITDEGRWVTGHPTSNYGSNKCAAIKFEDFDWGKWTEHIYTSTGQLKHF